MATFRQPSSDFSPVSLTVLLHDGSQRLASLAMEAGEVSLLLRGPTLRVGATLGHLSITDDSPTVVKDESFKKLLSVEGDDVVDFSYETFDPTDHATFPGYNSSVFLRAGSLRMNFMEQPIHDLYSFALLFSRLRPMYDATSQAVSSAAVQRASELQKERMHFDIIIKTPIIVFPRDGAFSKDVLVTRLGEIVARNSYDGGSFGDNKIDAGLHGIKLTSEFYDKDVQSTLQIIDDVSLTFDIVQPGQIDRQINFTDADTKVRSRFSRRVSFLFSSLLSLTSSRPPFPSDHRSTLSGQARTLPEPVLPHHVAPSIHPSSSRHGRRGRGRDDPRTSFPSLRIVSFHRSIHSRPRGVVGFARS